MVNEPRRRTEVGEETRSMGKRVSSMAMGVESSRLARDEEWRGTWRVCRWVRRWPGGPEGDVGTSECAFDDGEECR